MKITENGIATLRFWEFPLLPLQRVLSFSLLATAIGVVVHERGSSSSVAEYSVSISLNGSIVWALHISILRTHSLRIGPERAAYCRRLVGHHWIESEIELSLLLEGFIEIDFFEALMTRTTDTSEHFFARSGKAWKSNVTSLSPKRCGTLTIRATDR